MIATGEPCVSVIIPLYNREMYIERCIRSVLNQNYENIEIIVVDDGSTDSSFEIVKNISNSDPRVKAYRKINEGAGYARNFGIDRAAGEYLFFLDSDDYLLSGCIDRLVSLALEENADIVKCAWQRGGENNYNFKPSRQKIKIYDNKQAFCNRKVDIAVWAKLYKKSVIGRHRYPKRTLYDDEYYTYKLIYSAKKIVVINEKYYYYFSSNESIMRGKKKNQSLQYIEAYNERIDFFKKRNEEMLVGISHKELAIRLMLSYIDYENYEKSELPKTELLSIFKKEYILGKKYAFGIKEKLALSIFTCFPKMTTFIIKKINKR